jgi:hypothetical protein
MSGGGLSLHYRRDTARCERSTITTNPSDAITWVGCYVTWWMAGKTSSIIICCHICHVHPRHLCGNKTVCSSWRPVPDGHTAHTDTLTWRASEVRGGGGVNLLCCVSYVLAWVAQQQHLEVLVDAVTYNHTTRQQLRHLTEGHSTAQHSTAQHSTAQHSTAQHSTAQHSTEDNSTYNHELLFVD